MINQAKFKNRWARFWLQRAGLNIFGRLATSLGSVFSQPYKGRCHLATLSTRGYTSPSAVIHHPRLEKGDYVFIGDRVVIYQAGKRGSVKIGNRAHIHQEVIIETGKGGRLLIGQSTVIQPGCQFSAYLGSIEIGSNVQIAPKCAFYPYNHTVETGSLIKEQPLNSKGGIWIGDDCWLGVGVIVLDGVRIGNGAVIGAGSVVRQDIPDGAIAGGVPANVLKMRNGHTRPVAPNYQN